MPAQASPSVGALAAQIDTVLVPVLIPVLPLSPGRLLLLLAPIARLKLPACHFFYTQFHNHLVTPPQHVCACNSLLLLIAKLSPCSSPTSDHHLAVKPFRQAPAASYAASSHAASQPTPLCCVSENLSGRNYFSDVRADSAPLAPKISFNNTVIFSRPADLPKTRFRAHFDLP